MNELKPWFVGFPTYQYNENVKELARKHGLKIVDAKFQGTTPQSDGVPKLTVKSAKKALAGS
jgi:hypothetical protein